MLSSLEIQQSDDLEVRSADASRWRAICLFTTGAFLGLGFAAYAVGILPGDLHVRSELLTEDRSALRTLAWWVNLAGTWRVLLPASLVIAARESAAITRLRGSSTRQVPARFTHQANVRSAE